MSKEEFEAYLAQLIKNRILYLKVAEKLDVRPDGLKAFYLSLADAYRERHFAALVDYDLAYGIKHQTDVVQKVLAEIEDEKPKIIQ